MQLQMLYVYEMIQHSKILRVKGDEKIENLVSMLVGVILYMRVN